LRKQLLIVVTIVFALAIGGTALAHEVTHDSTITMHYANDEFAGKVTSTHDKCEEGRTVKIFRVEGDGKDRVEKGKTDEDGFYSFAHEDADGEYFARVTREVLSDTNKHSHVCARDSSPTITVNNPGPPTS
jgi:hypothetical protein